MSTRAYERRNRLLLSLPPSELDRLIPELEPAYYERERILLDVDSPLDQIYFPDSGIISVVAVYENGDLIEMATIGREGCTALQATLGAACSSLRLLVQIPGYMTKMSRSS